MEIADRFKHYPPSSNAIIENHHDIRENAMVLATLIEDVVPVGREQALALTKVEEAMMWANAGIARNQ